MKLSQLQGPAPTSLKLSDVTGGALDTRQYGTPEFNAAMEADMKREAEANAASMGTLGRGVAALDRGVTNLGEGLTQLGQHLDPLGIEAGAWGPEAAAEAKRVRAANDARLRDNQQLWERGGISNTTEGLVGDIVGQAAATAPLMAVGAPTLLGSATAAAGTGAVAGLLQPVTDTRGGLESLITGEPESSFAERKLGQAATGAALGAGTNVVGRGLGALAETLWPANVRARALALVTGKARNSPAAQEGADLAQRTGVNFTPGQEIESDSLKAIENAARQSFWSRDIAAEGDKARVQQLADYFDRTLDDITKADSSPIAMADKLRSTVKDTKNALEGLRRKTAEKDYGEVRDLIRGKTPISQDNLRAELSDIAAKNSDVGTPSTDALASFANKHLNNEKGLADPEKLVALRSYLSQVSGGQSKISGDKIDKSIAVRLMKAIDDDLDANAGMIGGDAGNLLRTANGRYRAFSQQLEAIDNSPLGKVLGEEFASDATGAFNSIAPEVVVERMNKLKPTQIAMVKNYLEKESPETLAMWRRSVVEDALEKSKQFPGSAGVNTAVLRPEVLVRELEKSPAVQALLPKGEAKAIADGIAAARKLGDKTGYNFSGTAAQTEILNLFNQPVDAVKQGANAALGAAIKTGGAALGTRRIAQIMTNPQARAALFTLQRLPPESAKARQALAYLTALYNSDEGEK